MARYGKPLSLMRGPGSSPGGLTLSAGSVTLPAAESGGCLSSEIVIFFTS